MACWRRSLLGDLKSESHCETLVGFKLKAVLLGSASLGLRLQVYVSTSDPLGLLWQPSWLASASFNSPGCRKKVDFALF